MIIEKTLNIHDENGFIGAAEFHDDVADLWSEDGDVDTYMFVNNLSGDRLYAEILARFAFELGIDKDELCLTDEDETEILY